MKECSKSIQRRMSDPKFLKSYFQGNGIDIGGKPDPLSLYTELFPLLDFVRTWDIEDGDAQILDGVDDNSCDFIHSSHCLEHLYDPYEGLENWIRVVKEGGYIVFTVPDEDLYEQGVFPSTFNQDHKWTFTISKVKSWSDKSINILNLVGEFAGIVAFEKIELLDHTYRYSLPRYDQTLTPVGECGIEVVLRKKWGNEISSGGMVRVGKQPSKENILHFNQYKDDVKSMKNSNNDKPPFTNEDDI